MMKPREELMKPRKKNPLWSCLLASQSPETLTLSDGTELKYRGRHDYGPEYQTHAYDIIKTDIPGYKGSTLNVMLGDPIQSTLEEKVAGARKNSEKPKEPQVVVNSPAMKAVFGSYRGDS